MVKFSVIIPVYNVKPYLKQCVDSIMSQTFKNFEVILVDDGSTDGSGDLCDLLAKENKYLKVIHKENGGLSSARNTGIESAFGEYLWFLDSDDFLISNRAFFEVNKKLTATNMDVCVFSHRKYWSKQQNNKEVFSDSRIANIKGDLNIETMIKNNFFKAAAWDKVVRRSLVIENGMSFPLEKIGEDIHWCADLLHYTNKLCFVKKDFLAYRQRDDSLCGIHRKGKSMSSSNRLELIKKTIKHYKNSQNRDLIFNYLAYEYVCFLGSSYPFYNDYKNDIKWLSFLLKYNLCKKVRQVSILKMIFGFRLSCFILNSFIKIKNIY